MPDRIDLHIKLGTTHTRLIKNFKEKTGLDRTALIKLALYRLATEEGIVLEAGRKD
jgi:hypothetical protein